MTNLSVYLDTSNDATHVLVGLYSDTDGKPSTLLTQGSVISPAAGSWNTVTVPAVQVAAGRTYWLTLLGGCVRTENHRWWGANESSILLLL